MAFIRSMVLPRGGVRTLARRPAWTNEVWEIYERVTGKPRPAVFAAANGEEPKPAYNDQPPF